MSDLKRTNRLLISWTIICLSLAWAWHSYQNYNAFDLEAHTQAYQTAKAEIHQKRLSYEQDWKKNPTKLPVLRSMARDYLLEQLTQHIFPAWHHTTWDFNGTSTEPRKGAIACGYFVTTTLEHCSLQLPRVKLAQQAASIIINQLCQAKSIRWFSQRKNFQAYLKQQPEGLYILGLDTHVGFLWKTVDKTYFIHSSNSGKRSVQQEPWESSVVIQRSKALVIGNLLDNELLLDHWIKGSAIKF